MLKLNDFILLKAMFNKSLSDSILCMNEKEIQNIVQKDYIFELENEFIQMEPLDVKYIKAEHKKNIDSTNLWEVLI